MIKEPAWVFVSHSSTDLANVRQVRNYLEERNASPILFHLRALTQPEEFWPLIKREIAARNFFLLCDSDGAKSSSWVRREREEVAKIAHTKAIRVGKIEVDTPTLDFGQLDRFLLNTQVFIVGDECSFSASKIMHSFGYGILGEVNFTARGLDRLGDGSQMSDDMLDTLYYAATSGWILVILSQDMIRSENFWRELPKPTNQNRIMFVLPSGLGDSSNTLRIPPELLVLQAGPPEAAIVEAAQRMLSSRPN